MSLLFWIPLCTGLWSGDTQNWLASIRIKLPLLLLPVAFASPFSFSAAQWQRLAIIFICCAGLACAWSLYYYFTDMQAVNEGYLRSRSLRTALANDHVRFSWMVAVAVWLAAWQFSIHRTINRPVAILFAALIVLLVAYLHILSARTGLISFYLSLLVSSFWFLFKKTRWKLAVLFLCLAIALPVASVLTVPTLQNRIRYMKYESAWFTKTAYFPGANDAVRLISLKAGWSLMLQHPVMGIGFGDIKKESRSWYEKKYPEMIESDKILPSGEWMMYGAGAGLPGFLIFSFCMIIPFFKKTNNRLLWQILHTTAAFSFLADIGLEVQYGVFLYAFIVCWWWKWLGDGSMMWVSGK